MSRIKSTHVLVLATFLASCVPDDSFVVEMPEAPAPGSTHDDLVTFFTAWRDFEEPPFVDGVPDYSGPVMAAQHRALARWMEALAAFDTTGWSVEERIDWHIVRAEMNGLDFDHRVRRPWARDPAYYVSVFAARSDVPAHEGPVVHGFIDLWLYSYPLSEEAAAELADRISRIPTLLSQARANLAGAEAADLWMAGVRSFNAQVRDLNNLSERTAGHAALDQAIAEAREASLAFRDWIEAETPNRTGASGVGRENYTWLMRNVHLVPYSWEEQETIMRRELARSHATLRLEENRNRELPEQTRIASAEEFDRRLDQSVDRYMEFLEREEVQSVAPWMDPALRAVNGGFTPAEPGEIRNFFSEVNYRDPDAFRPHMHHWIELAQMDLEPHESPIRAAPSLFNIYDARSEGLATGVEEWFMHLGLLEGSPRSRELVWIMIAQRAGRALSGLRLHSGDYDMEEAVAHSMKWTPRGWLPDGALVRGEQHLYLRQPGYGTSYLSGKAQIEELVAEYALQQGDAFTVKGFFDAFYGAGVIPTVLARWQLTGEMDPILAEGALGM